MTVELKFHEKAILKNMQKKHEVHLGSEAWENRAKALYELVRRYQAAETAPRPSLGGQISHYYALRGLKRPNAKDALLFAMTELAECIELLMARDGDWVRNNPGNKPAWDKVRFGEELGDVMMMLYAAGEAEGVDPAECLGDKIDRKLAEWAANISQALEDSGVFGIFPGMTITRGRCTHIPVNEGGQDEGDEGARHG